MGTGLTPENSARWEIWYWFLRQALKVGLPFDEAAYGAWGTKAEIESWGFKKWWRARGIEIARQQQVTEPEIVEQTQSTITIRFPLSMPSRVVKAKASSLVARARGTKRPNQGKKTSNFNYTKVKQLQRFLAIDLEEDLSALTLEEKGWLLAQEYKRIGGIHSKSIRTYRDKADALHKAGDRGIASRYRRRAMKLEDYKVSNTDRWDSDSAGKSVERNAEKLGRWAIQARLILLNVARGEFPGSDWYGSRRYAIYKRRLRDFGITSIGAVRSERKPIKKKRSTRTSARTK